MWPQAFWKHVYEPFIRRAAGLGKAPEGRDPDTYEHIHVHCDVLVIGGGVAGLAAAEAAAATGAKVIIADENPRFGGLADISGGTIDGQPSSTGWRRRQRPSPRPRTSMCSPAPPPSATGTTTIVMLFERARRSRPGAAGRRHAAPPPVEGPRPPGDPRHGRHRAPHRLCQQRPARRHAGFRRARHGRALRRGARLIGRRLHQQ